MRRRSGRRRCRSWRSDLTADASTIKTAAESYLSAAVCVCSPRLCREGALTQGDVDRHGGRPPGGARGYRGGYRRLSDISNCNTYQNIRMTDAKSASEAATCWPIW